MQLGQSAGARSNPIDRSATVNDYRYQGAGLAPHGQTTRFIYTPPANRRAILNYCQVDVHRVTASGAPARAYADIDDGSGGLGLAPYLDAELHSGVVDADRGFATACGAMIETGQAVIGFTVDNSTGGTITFTLGASITEYDLGG